MAPNVWLAFCLAALGQIAAAGGPAKDPRQQKRIALARAALEALEKGDTYAAVERLAREGDADAAGAYGHLVMHLYWKKKDLPATVAMARAGVQHALAAAARVAKDDPKAAAGLRSAGKAIAYNLASFTWPGWNEKGIQTTASDAAIGLDAAKTNLRLAQELDKGHLPLSRAHWMLAAQLLAAGQPDAARKNFAKAADRARAAGAKGEELLAIGFGRLVDVLKSPGDAAAEKALAETLAELKKIKDGDFFAGQITTARSVFERKGGN